MWPVDDVGDFVSVEFQALEVVVVVEVERKVGGVDAVQVEPKFTSVRGSATKLFELVTYVAVWATVPVFFGDAVIPARALDDLKRPAFDRVG